MPAAVTRTMQGNNGDCISAAEISPLPVPPPRFPGECRGVGYPAAGHLRPHQTTPFPGRGQETSTPHSLSAEAKEGFGPPGPADQGSARSVRAAGAELARGAGQRWLAVPPSPPSRAADTLAAQPWVEMQAGSLRDAPGRLHAACSALRPFPSLPRPG